MLYRGKKVHDFSGDMKRSGILAVKAKANSTQKHSKKGKKQYTWRMPSWNEIVRRSLPWFPGEWSKSPCKSFGILFEATAVCFVGYVVELCVGDTNLMATALWNE